MRNMIANGFCVALLVAMYSMPAYGRPYHSLRQGRKAEVEGWRDMMKEGAHSLLDYGLNRMPFAHTAKESREAFEKQLRAEIQESIFERMRNFFHGDEPQEEPPAPIEEPKEESPKEDEESTESKRMGARIQDDEYRKALEEQLRAEIQESIFERIKNFFYRDEPPAEPPKEEPKEETPKEEPKKSPEEKEGGSPEEKEGESPEGKEKKQAEDVNFMNRDKQVLNQIAAEIQSQLRQLRSQMAHTTQDGPEGGQGDQEDRDEEGDGGDEGREGTEGSEGDEEGTEESKSSEESESESNPDSSESTSESTSSDGDRVLNQLAAKIQHLHHKLRHQRALIMDGDEDDKVFEPTEDDGQAAVIQGIKKDLAHVMRKLRRI